VPGFLFWQLRDTGTDEQAVWRALGGNGAGEAGHCSRDPGGYRLRGIGDHRGGCYIRYGSGYLLEAVTKEKIAAETTLEATKAK